MINWSGYLLWTGTKTLSRSQELDAVKMISASHDGTVRVDCKISILRGTPFSPDRLVIRPYVHLLPEGLTLRPESFGYGGRQRWAGDLPSSLSPAVS